MSCYAKYGRLALIINNKHYINAIKLHGHLLVLDGIYVTICWTSDDCDGQVYLKLHLSVGQVILLFPYFDHCRSSLRHLAGRLFFSYGGDMHGPSVVFEAVDVPCRGSLHFSHIAEYVYDFCP